MLMMHRHSWAIAIAVGVFAPTSASAEPSEITKELAAKLPPISRMELLQAVQTGRTIRGRFIQGTDLSSFLNWSSGKGTACKGPDSLRIEQSYINGDIVIGQQEKSGGEDSSEPGEPQPPPPTDIHIKFPLAIVGSSVHGQVTLTKATFECSANLTETVFADIFRADNSTFTGEDAIFQKELLASMSTWRESVSFKRVQFFLNVEITALSRPGQSKFLKGADFQDAVFHRFANFMGHRFEGHTSFRYTRFLDEANFGQSYIGAGPAGRLTGPFYMTEFAGRAIFRGAAFKGLTFFKTMFRAGFEMNNVHVNSLTLMRPALTGDVDFSDSRIDRINFLGAMTVNGAALFRRARFKNASFARVIFTKLVDCEGAQFDSSLDLRRVTFQDDLHLEDAILPGEISPPVDAKADNKAEFVLYDTTFNKGVYAQPEHLLVAPLLWRFWEEDVPRFSQESVIEDDEDDDLQHRQAAVLEAAERNRRMWRELERAFHVAGDLTLENYAAYKLLCLEEADKKGFSKLCSRWSRWFWGFSLRPVRVLGWIGVTILGFAGIYWTQLSAVKKGLPTLAGSWARIKAAMYFSARTAWEAKFGFDHSTTTVFRVLTLFQSIGSKGLLACFAYSLSHTSPLLNELMKKLIP